jgi:hypothetical protein
MLTKQVFFYKRRSGDLQKELDSKNEELKQELERQQTRNEIENASLKYNHGQRIIDLEH